MVYTIYIYSYIPINHYTGFGYFSIQLGMENHPKLTFTPSFFRGLGLNHQPDARHTPQIIHFSRIINHRAIGVPPF